MQESLSRGKRRGQGLQEYREHVVGKHQKEAWWLQIREVLTGDLHIINGRAGSRSGTSINATTLEQPLRNS
jgi:hypothetical protein